MRNILAISALLSASFTISAFADAHNPAPLPGPFHSFNQAPVQGFQQAQPRPYWMQAPLQQLPYWMQTPTRPAVTPQANAPHNQGNAQVNGQQNTQPQGSMNFNAQGRTGFSNGYGNAMAPGNFPSYGSAQPFHNTTPQGQAPRQGYQYQGYQNAPNMMPNMWNGPWNAPAFRQWGPAPQGYGQGYPNGYGMPNGR